MPMIPETIIAMMAISKLGAIFTPIFSGYGTDAIAIRIAAAEAKLVITADGYKRNGKDILMKEQLDKALLHCPTVKKVVVVHHLNRKAKLMEKRDHTWTKCMEGNPFEETEVMDSDDPLMLIYTSGTTGRPKGTVHTHSGFPIKAAFDAAIGMDVKKGNTFFWYTDMGWMMGPFLVYGGLVNGATIVLYEGSPEYPNPDRLWKLVFNHSVTHLGISPTFIRSLMKQGIEWLDYNLLTTLRVIASTGEPWNDDSWLWLFQHVGKEKIPIFNYSGGTEIAGGILGNILIRPITPSTFNAALPGMAASVYNESGKVVEKEVGELVLTKPWVGMTKGFWNEPIRYTKAYWNRWQDTWVHGDWASVDRQGYWKITGRSDDTLSIAGKRIGPSEMETVLLNHKAVHEAAVIGVPDPIKGEAAACFVVLKESVERNELILQELVSYVMQNMGKALKPKVVHVINELPKTKNGKTMRRVIKAAYLHEQLGDVSTIENKKVLKDISELKAE
jgi:acetyl-CoA synthetase